MASLNNLTGDAAETHLEAYSQNFRACIGKLKAIWRQVGNEPDECRSQILLAADEAIAAWTKAVERAEAERTQVKALIQQHSTEIASIKAELDDASDSQSTEQDTGNSAPAEGEATLLRTLDALKGTLQFWRVKRASRLQAYEALMEIHVSLKRQLGLRHQAVTDVDLTSGALEYLNMENNKLLEEKGRRISRAEDELDKLRAMCRELGEDSTAAAAEVHPALSSLSTEKESAEVLGSVYKLVGSSSHLTAGGDLDLSDAMFARLAAKIVEMQRLKVEREAQSRDVLEMLGSLWDALSIPEDSSERSMVAKMLCPDRPQRLHKRTLDKCLAEVNRLEGCKAQAMHDLALSKARELEQLCISTRISPPHTGPLLAELDKPGQMTQVLSKLVRLVAEVQALVAKRAPILAQVSELLQAQADSAWLRQYNQNENRYKGRDASRNMHRAIKAAKLRERMGPMLEALKISLQEWDHENGAFLYDEQSLLDTHIPIIQAELDQIALEKAPKPKAALVPSVATASGRPPAGKPIASGPSPSVARPGATTAAPSAAVPRQSTSGGGGSIAGGNGNSNNGSPRSEAVRRMSMGTSSARDSGVYRGAMTGTAHITAKLMRSNEFAPGALRALAQQATAAACEATTGPYQHDQSRHQQLQHANSSSIRIGFHGSNAVSHPPLRQTPPARQTPPPAAARGGGMAASPAAGVGRSPGVGPSPAAVQSAASSIGLGVSPSPLVSKAGLADNDVPTATTSSGIKNSTQDMFKRYLGDASDVTSKPTPCKVTSSSPKPAKLSFSGAGSVNSATSGVDDDGVDDVRATQCDTPKSTASSRGRQQQPASAKTATAVNTATTTTKTPASKAAGSTVFSPEGGAKPSRIPRVRM